MHIEPRPVVQALNCWSRSGSSGLSADETWTSERPRLKLRVQLKLRNASDETLQEKEKLPRVSNSASMQEVPVGGAAGTEATSRPQVLIAQASGGARCRLSPGLQEEKLPPLD